MKKKCKKNHSEKLPFETNILRKKVSFHEFIVHTIIKLAPILFTFLLIFAMFSQMDEKCDNSKLEISSENIIITINNSTI